MYFSQKTACSRGNDGTAGIEPSNSFKYSPSRVNISLDISQRRESWQRNSFVRPTKIREIIRQTLGVLDQKTQHLREWPSSYKNRIASGDFKDTIGIVDAFPIVLKNRPQTDELRRQFWYFRERRWLIKSKLLLA